MFTAGKKSGKLIDPETVNLQVHMYTLENSWQNN